MARAFTVDRAGTLSEGMTLDLEQHTDVQPRPLQVDVDGIFPNGVSLHGERYVISGQSPAMAASPNIELVFELVRRASFPHAPSRFESWFGCETRDGAQAFADAPGWGRPGAAIYEVETDRAPFRADMSCLTLEGTILMVFHAAQRYWRGEANDQDIYPDAPPPVVFWELILPPPVRVLRRV